MLLMAALAGGGCGQVALGDVGGDYTSAHDRNNLSVVETFHFTPEVEALKRGVSDTLGGDIGYTLEHFPNHHRALAAMARLGLRDKVARAAGARFSVICYFERAVNFKPGDSMVRSLYAGYLLANGSFDAALSHMAEAARLEPGNATFHYNLGLMLVKKKDYAMARQHARQAYALGFPLPGLKNKLVQAGEWE